MQEYLLFIPPKSRRKPSQLLRELESAGLKEGIDCSTRNKVVPCRMMLFYGWGGEQQQAAIRAHPGDYAAFDLGYWLRDGFPERKWRISMNGFHCSDRIMLGQTPSDSRVKKEGIVAAPTRVRPRKKRVRNILLIGTSLKSQRVGAAGWTAAKGQEIRERFPEHRLVYRPKPMRGKESSVRFDRVSLHTPIEHELQRAELVVCRHSNVAVDACRMGVPVVCEDGAGAAIYPKKLDDFKDQPSRELRQDFLTRLSWWQWSINDIRAGGFWKWFRDQEDLL